MARELEIKLTVSSSALDAALAWLNDQPQAAQGSCQHLINTYYDTPEAHLNREKAALRVRQKGSACIQTVKTQGRFVNGMHEREEWEWPLSSETMNLDLLAETPLADSVDLSMLAPVFETNFNRQIVMIDDGEAIIECALDSGSVIAGQSQVPLNEVEFELKSGDSQRLLIWATRLAHQLPVFVNLISKAEQGYYLAGLYSPKVAANPSDMVAALFQCLGIAWLTGSGASLANLDLDELMEVAQAKGVIEPLRKLIESVHRGTTPEELMALPALGQLQLSLLA